MNLYKVSEIAAQCGVSSSAIYKIIRQNENEFSTGSQPFTTISNGKIMVTEAGLEYFLDRFQSKPEESAPQDQLVQSLLAQLEEKDRQLEKKDTQLEQKDMQINQLIEQSRNFQVLLKTEQEKLLQLTAPKPTLFQRLFSKKNIPDS